MVVLNYGNIIVSDLMHYSKEIIWHFTCYSCKGWWSIAASEDHKTLAPVAYKNLYCPHCGRNQRNSSTLKVLIDEG